MFCDLFLTLNNGCKMPALGYGTWQAANDEIEKALNVALEIGYRHIDTAPVYLNEKSIGRVLSNWFKSGKLKREDLFITTKLPPTAINAASVESRLRKSLSDLQLEYVDLYLVHTPFEIIEKNGDLQFNADGLIEINTSTDHIAVWKQMENMVNLGLTKSIGLSNFNKNQIERVLKHCNIRPTNLQIEHHVLLQQITLLEFCKNEGITVTAYAPLGSPGIAQVNRSAGVECPLPNLMEIKEVKEIADYHKKTPAQILIRWILDCGLCSIPKSTKETRIKENFNVFDFKLTDDQINTLKALDANVRVCEFKFFPGVKRHPEFPF